MEKVGTGSSAGLRAQIFRFWGSGIHLDSAKSVQGLGDESLRCSFQVFKLRLGGGFFEMYAALECKVRLAASLLVRRLSNHP